MTAISRGDIVAFRFPYRTGQTDYARPCLVLDAEGEELLLAYGTSSNSGANKGYEVRVLRDYLACGLDRPTRFVAARRIRVARNDRRFETPARMGALTSVLQARLPRLLGLLAAEFATAAERLEAERRGIHPTRSRRTRKLGPSPRRGSEVTDGQMPLPPNCRITPVLPPSPEWPAAAVRPGDPHADVHRPRGLHLADVSWPIETGWAWLKGGTIMSADRLICPDPGLARD